MQNWLRMREENEDDKTGPHLQIHLPEVVNILSCYTHTHAHNSNLT